MKIKELIGKAIIIIRDDESKKAFEYFLKTSSKSEIFFKRIQKGV